jgi:protein-L-isoaspartate(D-aspartate) O-methyltransferase
MMEVRMRVSPAILVVVFLTVACGRPRIAFPTSPPEGSGPDEAQATVADAFVEERLRLVEGGIEALGVADESVLSALRAVPRHEFVPSTYQDQAYENRPLPIGYGQTISQPYIVGLMSEALNAQVGERVLEVGTGSGYQAAVLAEMGLKVYSIEIIDALADEADERLQRLGYEHVTVKQGDGYFGWPEYAPYDGIIVTAAPDHVPPPLKEQLKVGAVLVIPVGPVGGYQELWRITRLGEDEFRSESLGGVRFVPLTREGGLKWPMPYP